MLAGLTSYRSRSRSDAPALSFAPDAVAAPARVRGGVVWVTGVAGTARANLVSVVHRQLERWWNVELIVPDHVDAWLDRADESGAAIVVSSGDLTAARATARTRSEAADRAFIEIHAVSDWDALVERTDSTIFEHVADFFTHLGHPPAPRRRVARPEATVRLDWHSPAQIEARIGDALQRAGLVP